MNKPPPFLVGATLLFWGWQTGFLIVGAILATLLEGARWIRPRWEFSDDDFAYIWTFCAVVFLASIVYAFTENDGPSGFRVFFQDPSFLTQRGAGTATARTAAAVFRWLPMVFSPFLAAQLYSTREGIPLESTLLLLRRKQRLLRRQGHPLPPGRVVNVAYPYVIVCLFAASVHASEDNWFFWGLCALLGWGLWPQRSRRFSPAVWALCLTIVIGLGYLGERGMGRLQNYFSGLNPSWLAGFGQRRFDPTRSRTELGRIGRVQSSGRIVIRLEIKQGPAPARLREASYRLFKNGHVWRSDLSEGNGFFEVPEREPGSFRFLDKTNTALARIGCALPGHSALLPLPAGTSRLDGLLVTTLTRNDLGAVLAVGPGLVVFDATYGPGQTIDMPPDETITETNDDLAVPEREKPALEQIVSELHLEGQGLDPALRTLDRFFNSNFTYSTWQEPDRSTDASHTTPLARFLLKTHRGHCEYFATAGVLLLRQAGIRARYAVGYAVHEASGPNRFVVRQRDAHAWCLVWDPTARVWRDFDPTPASWIGIEAERASRLQPLMDAWSWLTFHLAELRWGQTHLRRYLLYALVPILGLLLFQILFRTRHRRRGGAVLEPGRTWPGLDSEFYALEQRLRQRGRGRAPGEALSPWLQRAAADPALAHLQPALRELLALHYRYRFDPEGLPPAERDQLRCAARACLERLEQPPARL